MKLLLAFLLATVSISVAAQTPTALSLRTVITFGGTSITNTINVPTNQFAAVQFAIDKWNKDRTNAVPTKFAITNAAIFIIESAKDRVTQATNEMDLELPKTLQERVSVMSEADKTTIRNILLTY